MGLLFLLCVMHWTNSGNPDVACGGQPLTERAGPHQGAPHPRPLEYSPGSRGECVHQRTGVFHSENLCCSIFQGRILVLPPGLPSYFLGNRKLSEETF
jgi:hypothetical protein